MDCNTNFGTVGSTVSCHPQSDVIVGEGLRVIWQPMTDTWAFTEVPFKYFPDIILCTFTVEIKLEFLHRYRVFLFLIK